MGMRTVTEFAAPALKNAAKIQLELQTAGKTAEEMPAAMGEALKLEGDKLNHLLGALQAVGSKLDDLKRVLVVQLAEGEKGPHKGVQVGEHWLVAEYFPPLHGPKKPQGKEAPGRGGKDGDRKGKGRGKGRGDRDRGRGRDRNGETREGAPAGEARGPRRPPRGPRRPPAEGAGTQHPPVPSTGPAPRIMPKNPIEPPKES